MKIEMPCGAVVNAKHPTPIKHQMACEKCQALMDEKMRKIRES